MRNWEVEIMDFSQRKPFLYTGTIYEYMYYDIRGRGMIAKSC